MADEAVVFRLSKIEGPECGWDQGTINFFDRGILKT
jgi:hypothetical protein